MIPLVDLLLSAGPALIRTVGSLFDEQGAKVANKVADVVQGVAGTSKEVAAAQVTTLLAQLSPDDLQKFQDLKVRLEEIAAEREKNQLAADTAVFTEEETTKRAELQYGTDYTRDTRPWIARLSAVVAFAYVLVSEVAKLISEAWGGPITTGADLTIASMLITPALGYMGMRTLDAFSRWKTGSVEQIAAAAIGKR